ncbi:MAG: type II toxin-antitoxin system RatA family toxin [Hyphomicrobiaceae bacterium]|jgi:coenzyme Q-binding protein COQ10
MPSFSTRRRVPFTPSQMFDLVADVEKYPRFLPLCEGLVIRSRGEKDGREVLVAAMTVGYKAIRETFTSRVALDPAGARVDVSYVDGPFRYLENGWKFVATSDGGCDVVFDISYEMKSKMFELLVGAVFERAFRKFAEAFEARALQVYGPPQRPAITLA